MVDNYYHMCPPMMEDGRLFTDYRTATRRNEYVKYINDIVRDDEYRAFLQQNANRLIESEWEYTRNNKSCFVNECVHNYPTRVYPPWFIKEKQAYDSLFDPKRKVKYLCSPDNDYRSSVITADQCPTKMNKKQKTKN